MPGPSDSGSANQAGSSGKDVKVEELSVEEQAKHWFLQGVGLERKGELYDAVKCYRRAVQLVPDIEYRLSTISSGAGGASESSSSVTTPNDSDDEKDDEDVEEDEDFNGPLVVKFLKIIEANGWNFFQKLRDDSKMHLNDLPVELLSYILRYLVFRLDLLSLINSSAWSFP